MEINTYLCPVKNLIQINMASIISILNFKGGVGKTTTTLNLGAALAMAGKKTLLIDIDVQRNTTNVLGYRLSDGSSLYELMKNESKDYPIYDTNTSGLQFIPSSMKLSTLVFELANMFSRETILRECLSPLQDIYDYILIDCPPNTGVLTDNAIAASNTIIVPVSCDAMSLQGVEIILARVKEAARVNKINIGGFLINRYNARRVQSRNVVNALSEYGVNVFKTYIRECEALKAFCENHQNIFEYDAKSNGAKDYEALAKEIIELNI